MLDYDALHSKYGKKRSTGAVQETAPVSKSGPIDYAALHEKYGTGKRSANRQTVGGAQTAVGKQAIQPIDQVKRTQGSTYLTGGGSETSMSYAPGLQAKQEREQSISPVTPTKTQIPTQKPTVQKTDSERLAVDMAMGYQKAMAAQRRTAKTQRLAQLDLGAAKQEVSALETERKRMEAELEEAWKRKSDAQNAVSLYDYEDNDAYLAALEAAGGDEATEMSYRLDELKKTISAKQKELDQARYVQFSLLPTRDDFQVYAARGGGMKNNVVMPVKRSGDGTVVGLEVAEKLFPKTQGASPTQSIYDKLTDEEARIYSYLLAKDNERGTNHASEYLAFMMDPMKARRGREQADLVKNSGILRPAATAGYGLASGFDQAVTGIAQNFSDTPLPASALQYGAGYVREDLENAGPKILGSSLGQIGFDLASTTGNMAPSIGAGMVGGPAAAAGVTFLSSGGNAYGEALAQGYSKGEARAYGVLAGASEAGLQYALSGISSLGGKLPNSQMVQSALNNIKNAALRIPAKYAVAATGEMTEEYLQAILTPYFRNIALGENNEFKLFTEDAAYAALLAALSVGVLEGPKLVSTDIGMNKVGKTAQDVNMEVDTPAARMAMMRESAKTGFGQSGETALVDIYDEAMASQIDPAEAYGIFSRVYTAAMTGQEATGVEDAPRRLVEAAQIAAKYDLRAAVAEAGEESKAFGKVAAEPAETQQQAVEMTREPGFDYNDGHTQRFVTEMDTETAERMDAVARSLGVAIRAVDSVFGGEGNAQITGNEILIDERVGTGVDGVTYVLGHEFTHRIQQLAGSEYAAFQAALDQQSLQDTAAKMAELYRAKGVELTEAQALDEATADLAGEMLQNGAILDDFIARNQGNKTLLQNVRDWFRGIIAKLSGGEKRRGQIAVEKLNAALDAAARNAQAAEGAQGGAADAGARYLLKGTRADGIEVYETSESVRALPWKERKQRFLTIMHEQYRGRTAKFTTSDGEVYYAKFDDVDIQKNIYGDRRSDSAGRDAKINVGADGDIFDLVENTTHKSSDAEQGKTGGAHKGVTGWEYFIKTVQIDGHVFDLLANVRKKADGEYVYSIQLNENKTMSASPVAVPADSGPASEWGTTDEHRIPQESDGVKPKYSLKEYSEAEKKDHAKAALSHFGHTYTWKETGYLTTDGKKIDFSGKHDGAPGGYRTVDHRDISDALGLDYGGEEYSGAMTQFMAEGNIRISPESGGINLSVMPTDTQMEALSDFISKERGEVILDIDTPGGDTVASVEYPRGTRTGKVLKDIKQYFADGTIPEVREIDRYHTNYSLKGTEHAGRIVELERENKDLQVRYEQARKQTRRSDTGKVSEAKVGRFAKVLMDHVGVKGDAKAVGLKLQTMYDAVASGHDLDGAEFTFRDFRRMANDIAEDLVRRAVLREDTMYEDYADLRAHIRDTRIVVDAQTREDITDYEDFRKRNMGRLRLAHGETGNIDLVYNELSREWPGLFPEDLAYGQDQLERIAEVMETIYARKEFNPWEGDMGRATQAFANEIMEQFWELPGQEPTFADRQWRQREELKRRHMAELRDAVRAERNKGKLQEQKLKQWYADKAAEQRAYKAESEARSRLLKLAARMKRMPVDNTNKTVIRELIGNLDTEARHLTGKKLTELTELRQWYEGKTNPDSDTYDPDFILDKRTADNLRRLEMKHIDDMTLQDVKDLTQVLQNLENEIRTSKRLIGQEEDRDVYQLGEQIIEDVEASPGTKKDGVGYALDKHIVTETLSPLRQVRRMVGYKADSPMVKLTEGLADGQRKMMDYQMRAGKPFERFARDKSFTKTFSGKGAETVKISGWVKGKIREVEITPAMRVSLWLHSQNNQNLLHMRDGGVRVPDLELYRKGKIERAYTNGTVVKLSPDMAKNLWGQMTPTERAFAREVQKYFREVSQPAINEVSRQLKGYDIAEVENYFPIHTDWRYNRAEFAQLKFDGTIEGMGFLQERQDFAHNPMYLEDVNTVVEQAIRMHGKYVGLAIPVRNFSKVMKMSEACVDEKGDWHPYGDSFWDAIGSKWQDTGTEYIKKLMTDLQGGGKQASAWTKTLGKVRSNYAGAVLTLNASVAMKQAASYPTAAAVLGWGPLMKAMKNFGKVDLDLIAKYTPLQWYRSKGFSTKELGDIQNYGGPMQELLGKKGLNWIQGIDLATTRKLWKASEYYVRENSPSLRVGSEAYYRAVADIYNRVIEETQPNYTTMQRPQLLRSDDTLMGNLAMFKTQPFQNFNILYDAAGEFRAVMERAKAGTATQTEVKAARKNLSRAVTSQVGQLAVFAAMTMAWGMFRGRKDKYEDDEGNVTFWSALEGLLKDMGSGVASMVPFGTEAYEFGSSKIFGERYYGMEPVTVEAIGNAVTSLSKLGDTIWGTAQSVLKGEDVDWKGMLYQLDDSADDISKVAGVPYENVLNLFNAVARWALIGTMGRYQGEYAALHLTTNADKSQAVYMDLLYKAMENDREAYNKLWSQMVKDGFDQEKIKSALESRMKKAQGVTKTSELEERYVTPEDRDIYERALNDLLKSDLARRASEEQLKDAKEDAYKFATRAGSEKDQARWDRWEDAGMDAGMYALYQLAKDMADKPNENGNLGTITNEEREEAIRSLGLSRRDSAAMWILAGGSEKSNPWG